MLVKIEDYCIINLDRISTIEIDTNKDKNALLNFFFADGMEMEAQAPVYFADEHLRDLALSDIITSYQEGYKYCDITKYVKKGE